jgi:hypothetical protein
MSTVTVAIRFPSHWPLRRGIPVHPSADHFERGRTARFSRNLADLGFHVICTDEKCSVVQRRNPSQISAAAPNVISAAVRHPHGTGNHTLRRRHSAWRPDRVDGLGRVDEPRGRTDPGAYPPSRRDRHHGQPAGAQAPNAALRRRERPRPDEKPVGHCRANWRAPATSARLVG